MSLFSSQATWPPQCLSANQSPVNLVQSSAKATELNSDLVMDDGYISQATVSISDEGLILSNSSSLGTCKFRGHSYVCQALAINHPSHHTIEGVQADGEVTAIFKQPTGEILCVSALFRANPNQGANSYGFFKQFVPYGLSTGDVQVKLGNWSLAMMVPPSSAFFTYSGSTLVPPCTPCDWIVFKTMISMDTGDFAYLTRNAEAGSRTIVAQGDRQIYFNDTQNLSGIMPNDGKLYLRLTGKGLSAPPNGARIDLKNQSKSKKEQEDEDKHPTTWVGKSKKAVDDHVKSNGGLVGTLELWTMLIAIAIGCYLGYKSAQSNPFDTQFIKPVSSWTRDTAVYLWEILKSLPEIIYNWTIGWVTFLLRPRQPRPLPVEVPKVELPSLST
jgi:carbonic anhydrase